MRRNSDSGGRRRILRLDRLRRRGGRGGGSGAAPDSPFPPNGSGGSSSGSLGVGEATETAADESGGISTPPSPLVRSVISGAPATPPSTYVAVDVPDVGGEDARDEETPGGSDDDGSDDDGGGEDGASSAAIWGMVGFPRDRYKSPSLGPLSCSASGGGGSASRGSASGGSASRGPASWGSASGGSAASTSSVAASAPAPAWRPPSPSPAAPLPSASPSTAKGRNRAGGAEGGGGETAPPGPGPGTLRDGEVSTVLSAMEESERRDLPGTAERRRSRLDEAAETLVSRLLRFVDSTAAASGAGSGPVTPRSTGGGGGGGGAGVGGIPPKRRGLTLPASAVGWLTMRLWPSPGEDRWEEGAAAYAALPSRPEKRSAEEDRGRIERLRRSLPGSVEFLKVTNEEWPPPPPSTADDRSEGRRAKGGDRTVAHGTLPKSGSNERRGWRRRGGAGAGTVPAASDDSSVASAGSIFSLSALKRRPVSRGLLAYYYAPTAPEGDDALAEGPLEAGSPGGRPASVAGAPSRSDDGALPFLARWHALRYRPRVDLALFPSVTVLILDGVMPECVSNLSAVRGGLELLRVERGCVYDASGFFFSSRPFPVDAGEGGKETAEDGRSDALGGDSDGGGDNGDGNDPAETGDAIDGESYESVPNGFAADGKGSPRLIYPSLVHLKLSRCGISEMSGLGGARDDDANDTSYGWQRGRRRRQRRRPRPSTPPPLSAMPNLQSLNLSHNDIVLASTACAGLSDLPRLEALDLSHNFISW